MVKGVRFEFANGEEYIIPPLTLGSLELLQDKISAFQGGVSKDSVETIVSVTLAALQRNYPDMTPEKVKSDLLDVGNMLDVFGAVMDIGGLKRKEQEAGELKPEPVTA